MDSKPTMLPTGGTPMTEKPPRGWMVGVLIHTDPTHTHILRRFIAGGVVIRGMDEHDGNTITTDHSAVTIWAVRGHSECSSEPLHR